MCGEQAGLLQLSLGPEPEPFENKFRKTDYKIIRFN
jgi:hypothetical protein